MSKSTWQVGGAYTLRNGAPAVILDLCDGRLFGRFFGQALCEWVAISWDAKTGENGGIPGGIYDLMPPPAPRVTRKVWVSIYPDGIASSSPSRETADHFSNPSRLACICIELDISEGYGLDKDQPPILVRAG